MLRRDARLRQEYLYRKSLDAERSAAYEKRLAIRTAIAEGRPIPTELRATEASLRESDAYTDAVHDAPRTHVDDEYAALYRDPEAHPARVVLTTSRAPSARLAQFAKEVRLLIPGCTRLNRGSLLLSELVTSARAAGFSDVLVLHETRGEPDGLVVSHLPHGPTAYFNLRGCVTRHDVRAESDAPLPNMSEAVPALVFHGFASKLGRRTEAILKALFPVQSDTEGGPKRIISFANFDDVVSFRHHEVSRAPGVPKHIKDSVQLTEVGPRFEMGLYQIKLGTVDQDEADDEWVLRPYMNTAKNRKALG